MSKTMLDHTKSVLKGVSFDVDLFGKELSKAYELEELINWLLEFTQEKPELRQCILNVK
jgi:hypothetical protein